MKKSVSLVILIALIVVAAVTLLLGQNRASVEMTNSGPFRPGDSITFDVKLNAPMPKGAHFAFRISPISQNDQFDLGSGQAVDASETEFRVSGKLPESALPGKWHIAVIYLFLPGISWTSSTITPNDVTFLVEGKTYPIPTKADVTIVH